MAPVFVMLASPLVLREKLTTKTVICISVALCGMVLVSGVADSGGFAASEFVGVAFALGAALLYACVVLINKKISGVKPLEKTTVQLASASVVLLPYILLTEDFSTVTVDAKTVALLLTLGVIHTGAAYTLYFGSLGSLSAGTAAILSYTDPVVAVLLSALLLKEPMSVPVIIGTVLVIGALIAAEVQWGSKEKRT